MPPPVRLRVPYTEPLPRGRTIPPTAASASGAVAALVAFLAPAVARPSAPPSLRPPPPGPLISTTSPAAPAATRLSHTGTTAGAALLLTGAGISVASGLADYRGERGTYTLNRSYRPVYYGEFCASHPARQRYWARSFVGWTTVSSAKPNAAHDAVRRLGELGVAGSVITQNVDSFHPQAHPALPTLELHGALRTLTCLTCAHSYPRLAFQSDLARLNPAWAAFLADILSTNALDSENPVERARRGLTTNPDGDVDIPGAPYTSFRYPACPACLRAGHLDVRIDADGAWQPGSAGGVLKPAVVMFGESIPPARKLAAETAVDGAARLLVVGTSLATYSAWRLVRRAKERGLPIGILNIGGVRGEEGFFEGVPEGNTGREAVRCEEKADVVLPEVVRILEEMRR